MFRMVFIGPVPNASHGGKDAWVLQPSTARAPVALAAQTVDDARAEAAAVWACMTHYRYADPDGYWIVDARDKLIAHEERDEAATPRSPADLAWIDEFRRALIAAGGGLVLIQQPEPEPEPGFETELDGLDLVHDIDDRINLADLVADDAQRAMIARHPVAGDPAQLERALEFIAGGQRADRGTVGDLQRAWVSAAAGLAAMAEAGLLLSTDDRVEMRRAA